MYERYCSSAYLSHDECSRLLIAITAEKKERRGISQIINADGTARETGEEENYSPMIYSRVIMMMYQLTSQICLQTLPPDSSLFA